MVTLQVCSYSQATERLGHAPLISQLPAYLQAFLIECTCSSIITLLPGQHARPIERIRSYRFCCGRRIRFHTSVNLLIGKHLCELFPALLEVAAHIPEPP